MISDERRIDEDLVDACRQGERWAQRELFERHSGSVFRALISLSGNRAAAEDLLQESFFRAFRGISGFRGHSSLRTWLMSIATNTFFEHRRRERTRRRHIVEIEDIDAAAGGPLVLLAGSTSDRGPTELRDLVIKAMSTIPVRDRTIIALHDIEGYRYAEIAEILDVAPGTVGSRLSRGRRKLLAAIRGLLGLRGEEKLTIAHLYGHGGAESRRGRNDPGGRSRRRKE